GFRAHWAPSRLSWPIVTGFGASAPVGVEAAGCDQATRCWVGAIGGPRSRSVGEMADAVHLDAGEVRAVAGRIGGHWFERLVGPAGPAVADPEAIRMDGGCWIRPRLVRLPRGRLRQPPA